jgi:hypothetical protein
MEVVMEGKKLLLATLTAIGMAANLSAASDLGIIKRLVVAPSGVFAAEYEISVTNYGPDATGAVTVTDTPGSGMGFSIEFLSNPAPAPWVCTFNSQTSPTSVACTHPGPIAVGNSVSLPISFLALTAGRYENCAQVAHAGSVTDPDTSNNGDCACADFKPCRDITIDVSTGTHNGQMLGIGTNDDDWTVVSTPLGNAANAPAKVVGPFHGGFVTSPPANWISASNPQSTDVGDYRYRLRYSTSSQRFLTCIISIDYASDNEVFFDIDGNPIAQNVASDQTAFTTMHNRTWFAPEGTHTLNARVHNDGGPTSLFVHGVVFCSCNTFIDLFPLQ